MSEFSCLPYFAQGKVVSGFGRGSKDLGIPTANFPNDVVSQLPDSLKCGIYYGWAAVDGVCGVHQMVLSVGWNVFYGNEVKTMETHIIKKFDEDFYGENLRVVILGFIRPMCNFDSKDALITAIYNDIQVSKDELVKEKNFIFSSDPFFMSAPSAKQTSKESMLSSKESQLLKGDCVGKGLLYETDQSAFMSAMNGGSVNGSGCKFNDSQHNDIVVDGNKINLCDGESIPCSLDNQSIEKNELIYPSNNSSNLLNHL